MELKELFHQKKINFKMYNVCLKNNINTQNELIEFYKKNSDFLQFKNCGNKTNLELINFCENKESNSIDISEILPTLNPEQKAIINNYITDEFKKLNNRTQNGLIKLLSKEINIDSFERKGILDPNYEYLKIPFLGLKSNVEIKNFFSNLNEYILRNFKIETKYFI